jgi:hypothetical protein
MCNSNSRRILDNNANYRGSKNSLDLNKSSLPISKGENWRIW